MTLLLFLSLYALNLIPASLAAFGAYEAATAKVDENQPQHGN
jgi:hypothetical protein